MVKIDKKDKKILYQLDLNCRQSLRKIGKKVGLSKDVVSYRINKMQDQGIITNFWTVIDTYKLGYVVYRFYLSFQYATESDKSKVINHISKYKNLWTLTSLKQRHDLSAVFWVDDINELNQFWTDTLSKYGEFLSEKILTIFVQVYGFKLSFLLDDKNDSKERLNYEIFGGKKTSDIDKLDYQLLNDIALDARASLVDLAEKYGCSSQTINYRLKNLEKNNIIQGYRVGLDFQKLGFQHFKVDVHLIDHKNRNKMIEYVKQNPYVLYVTKSIGFSDIEFEIIVKNTDEIVDFIEKINTIFPKSIKKYEFFSAKKTHKLRFLPELYEIE